MNNKRELYLEQLNSLHEIYLGLKTLHSCTTPPEGYMYNDPYLSFAHFETTMLLLGIMGPEEKIVIEGEEGIQSLSLKVWPMREEIKTVTSFEMHPIFFGFNAEPLQTKITNEIVFRKCIDTHNVMCNN